MQIPKDLLKAWDVLIIDDEEDSLEVAEIILHEYGARIHSAANGEEGLKLVQQFRPKFVICDLSMPVMDGWGFISTVKKERELMDIPVIALTAHAMYGDRERAIKAGFHNYLSKPLTVETFMADLVKLLVDIPELKDMLKM